MIVTPKFTQAEIEAAVKEGVEHKVNALKRDLQYIGEEVVTEARTGAKTGGLDYKQQTGNLRSSIGYIITYKGETTGEGGFIPMPGRESGEEGAKEGKAVAERIATEEGSQESLKLTVVAGMDYATHLHAKGYDVLDSAELLANERLKELKADYEV